MSDSFTGRTLKYQLSDDMISRIQRCQKICNDLTERFDRSVAIGTNMGVENMRQVLKTIDDNHLGTSLHLVVDHY